MSIRLHIENLRPIYVCAFYRPSSGDIGNFNSHIVALLDNLTTDRKYDVYFGGDFNIDYAKASLNGKYLKNFESRFSLTQIVHNKTRPLYSDSIVDLIFTNNSIDMTTGTLDLNISDHLPVWVVRKKTKVKPVTSEFTGRTYKNYKVDTLRERILEINYPLNRSSADHIVGFLYAM